MIREARRDGAVPASVPSEPSYAPLDSRDFVEDAEIEEVSDDSTAGRASERSPPGPQFPKDDDPAAHYVPPEPSRSDAIPGESTAIERRPQAAPSEPRLEVDDDAIELAESETADDDLEIREAVAQALADAASFRRVELFAKALASLRDGAQPDPMSRDVHEACRESSSRWATTRSGRGHVVVIAGMQLEAGDVDGRGARAL